MQAGEASRGEWSARIERQRQRTVGGLGAEDRQAALEQIDTTYKKKDPTAIFAKAQLLMHEDPQKALETLEQIDLKKVMAPVADEARAQRAMIHLMLGETSEARTLADKIDLGRHKEPKVKATLASTPFPSTTDTPFTTTWSGFSPIAWYPCVIFF